MVWTQTNSWTSPHCCDNCTGPTGPTGADGAAAVAEVQLDVQGQRVLLAPRDYKDFMELPIIPEQQE